MTILTISAAAHSAGIDRPPCSAPSKAADDPPRATPQDERRH